MTFDDMLKQAFEETAKERAEHSRKVYKKHRFSLAFKLWEFKTLRDLKKNRFNGCWTLRKARRVVIMLIAAVLLSVGVTAYAAVALIGRFGLEDKVDYSKLLIETHPSNKTTFEEYYGLPEEYGWELVDYDLSPPFTVVNYRHGEKNVTFLQNIIDEGNMGNVNTENADIEMISLYTENDGFVLEIREDWTGIYWIYDGYLLEISGNINKNEAINLAYSTKIVVF